MAIESGSGVASLPPQGLYEGCAPGTELDACVAHLETIRAVGFRYVLNYSAWYGTPVDVLRYADAAVELGLKLIWPLNHPAWRGLDSLSSTYPSLLRTGRALAGWRPLHRVSRDRSADPASAESAARAVGLVANHPATWGFYIGDELPTSEAGRVRRLSVAVRTIAPAKPQLYVARPGVDRLQPFARIADVAGADTYPIGSGDPPVTDVARSVRAAGAAAGVRTAMVLQAFSWSQYRPDPPSSNRAALPYPSKPTLRAMRDAAIRNANPMMILWYSYQDILRSDDPRKRWRDLTHAALAPLQSETETTETQTS